MPFMEKAPPPATYSATAFLRGHYCVCGRLNFRFGHYRDFEIWAQRRRKRVARVRYRGARHAGLAARLLRVKVSCVETGLLWNFKPNLNV